MTSSQTRLDVRTNAELGLPGEPDQYRWIVQTTSPLRDEFVGVMSWVTRTAAVISFEATAERMGWVLHPEMTEGADTDG